ncbi:hypothetical protein JD844_006607 [Phrynosoma platyrhinos]|uniref:Uncharacterized protein n=1 Tax=Phrynosoma platyrhinos TaxID=52577 RepID=A0ABQ7T1N9_PHRPL|nr:hypothetical protein JD844_006607 [Phrynosoma platyrhinos]
MGVSSLGKAGMAGTPPRLTSTTTTSSSKNIAARLGWAGRLWLSSAPLSGSSGGSRPATTTSATTAIPRQAVSHYAPYATDNVKYHDKLEGWKEPPRQDENMEKTNTNAMKTTDDLRENTLIGEASKSLKRADRPFVLKHLNLSSPSTAADNKAIDTH